MKNEKLLLSLLAVLLSTSAASAEMVRVEGGTFVMADCHEKSPSLQ